ncbi:MAG: hypothetical protein ACOYL5_16285 [Phototrophicaceae bacterium]|jgi:hypothetical protein
MANSVDVQRPFFTALLWGIIALCAVTLGVFALNHGWQTLLATHEPLDEFAYADMARMAAYGAIPFREIWDIKPPINTYLLVPFIWAFGNSVLAVRIAVLTQALALTVISAQLIRSLTKSVWVTALSSVLVVTYALWTAYLEGWQVVFLMTLFTTLAALAVLNGKGDPVACFWAGICLAVAFYIKAVAAPEGFAILALAAYAAPAGKKWRAAILVVVGGLVGLAAFILLWWGQGVLESVWLNAFYNSYLYSVEPDGQQWHFSPEFWEFFRLYFLGQSLPYLLPLLPLSVIALAAAWKDRRLRTLVLWMLFWALTEFLGAIIGRSLRRTYFVQMLPSLFALNALAICALAQRRRVWQIVGALGVMAALIVNGTVGAFPQQWRALTQTAWQNPNDAAFVQGEIPTVNALQQIVPEGECFWAWDSIGLVRYLANRNPCTPEHAAHLMMVRESFDYLRIRAEYLNGLFAAKPRYHTRYWVWGYFPELERFANRYLGEKLFNGFEDYGTIDIYAVDMSVFHDAYARFDDDFEMIGYDLYTPQPICAGDAIETSQTWRLLNPPARYYSVFIQLLSADQTVRVVGLDSQPHSALPTIQWTQRNMLYLGDTFTLEVPADTPAGTYVLVTGFYDNETLERIPAYDADGARLGGDYVILTEIAVSACD